MKRSGLANSLSGVGGSFSERNNWRSNKGHGAKLEQKEGVSTTLQLLQFATDSGCFKTTVNYPKDSIKLLRS